MKEHTLTNAQVIGLINAYSGTIGQGIAGKKLPARLSLAKNRFIQSLTDAYNIYEKTLADMCKPYEIEPGDAMKSDNPELKASVTELLRERVIVPAQTIPVEILDMCGTDRFDMLTDAEVDLISWVVEDL